MKTSENTTRPLNEDEIELLDEMLLEYGNENSVLSMGGLDGFLTAVLSSPDLILPSLWYPTLWGGHGFEPKWETLDQLQTFMDLLITHMNFINFLLIEHPQEFQAFFELREVDGKEFLIAEDWCFGYMQGFALANFPKLPAAQQRALDAIALHGTEENFAQLDLLSTQQHQQSVRKIEAAALKLFQYGRSLYKNQLN